MRRVAVDTSVWVQYLRGRDESVRRSMHVLLDEDRVTMPVPVRIEILSGLRRGDTRRLLPVLDAIPTFLPDDGTWETMERWAIESASRGERFGVGDLLIAALSSCNDCSIWSLDSDFHRLSDMGFVDLFEPEG